MEFSPDITVFLYRIIGPFLSNAYCHLNSLKNSPRKCKQADNININPPVQVRVVSFCLCYYLIPD